MSHTNRQCRGTLISFLLAHRWTIRYQSHPFGRLWRNWQTRYVEVVVGDNPVKVRILLAAPYFPGLTRSWSKHSGCGIHPIYLG
jgi:hypothetical protein